MVLTYKALADNKVLYNRMVLANELYYGEKFDVDVFIQDIEKITIEAVVRVAKNIEINTVYLLGGRIDE